MSAPVCKMERIDTGPVPGWTTESVKLSWTGGSPPFMPQASVDPGDPAEPWHNILAKPTLKRELVIPNVQSYPDPNSAPMPGGEQAQVRNDKCFFRVQSEVTMPAPTATRANDVNTVSWVPPEE